MEYEDRCVIVDKLEYELRELLHNVWIMERHGVLNSGMFGAFLKNLTYYEKVSERHQALIKLESKK